MKSRSQSGSEDGPIGGVSSDELKRVGACALCATIFRVAGDCRRRGVRPAPRSVELHWKDHGDLVSCRLHIPKAVLRFNSISVKELSKGLSRLGGL